MNSDLTFGIERGTPIRMPSNSLLCISSSDRYPTLAESRKASSSPFDFSITKSENIMAGSITRISLTEFSLPWDIPNINQATNGIGIVFNTGGNPNQNLVFWIQADPTNPVLYGTGGLGFYNGYQIAINLETQIRAYIETLSAGQGQNFNLTYEVPSGSFRASFTGTLNLFNFVFVPINTISTAINEPLWNSKNFSYPQNKSLYDLMGWYNSSNTYTPATNQFSRIAPLVPTKYVDVVCDQLTYNQELRDSASQPVVRDILARIYLTTEFTTNDIPERQYALTPLGTAPYLPDPAVNPTVINAQVFPTILGTAPFTLYREFNTPKYIKWSGNQNIPGFIRFSLYDDQGNILSANCPGSTLFDDNLQPDWCMTLLASET